MPQGNVLITPFSLRGSSTLAGFVVAGRWPASTREWVQFLILATRLAAVPGTVPAATVFQSTEDKPEKPSPETVGLVFRTGPVIGEGAPLPGSITYPHPRAVFLLHPPGEIPPSTPEASEAASGCLLLPGLPDLDFDAGVGFGHQATWVEVEIDGTVTMLLSRHAASLGDNVDTAVLGMLLE
jgi:hypothetical protein